MANKKVQMAIDSVRSEISRVSEGLSKPDYACFLEELVSEAEGWNMQLREWEDA